jgi:hypothetical protein
MHRSKPRRSVPSSIVVSLAHARLDDELDAASAAQVERHLAGCPVCAAEARRLQALRVAIRGRATYHRLPEQDRSALRCRLRQGASARPSRARGFIGRRTAVGMTASLLVGLAIGGWLGPEVVGGRGQEPPLGTPSWTRTCGRCARATRSTWCPPIGTRSSRDSTAGSTSRRRSRTSARQAPRSSAAGSTTRTNGGSRSSSTAAGSTGSTCSLGRPRRER